LSARTFARHEAVMWTRGVAGDPQRGPGSWDAPTHFCTYCYKARPLPSSSPTEPRPRGTATHGRVFDRWTEAHILAGSGLQFTGHGTKQASYLGRSAVRAPPLRASPIAPPFRVTPVVATAASGPAAGLDGRRTSLPADDQQPA